MDGRECVKCGEWKPRKEFHRHAQCKGGINTVCKACRKPISKAQWADKSVEAKILHRAKTRATKRGFDFDLELDDIVIPEVCPVLGIPIDVPSIDRHDSSKGYTKDNIVIMSNRANVLKNDGTLEEFKMLIIYLEGACEI